MKHKDGKPTPQLEKISRAVPISIMFCLFCGLSFYLGSIFCSEKDMYLINNIAKAAETCKKDVAESVPLQLKTISFSECSNDFQDYTPCTDPKRWHRYGLYRLTFMERHCPPAIERKECLVPLPDGYKVPIRWPQSRLECWYRNVPYDWINNEKSNQNWVRKEGEKFVFPGGGTMFPHGVSKYVNLMERLIPEMKDGTIRTAIDTGCGVASWGGELLGRGILTVSLAPRDNHEAQVQFALERGIPAILGIISTQRLPFPSNSFDMAHCSRCLIPWTEFGGIYLLEIHRILRPGGFWILSGPPINYEVRWSGWKSTLEEQKSNYEKLNNLLISMCFKMYNKKKDISIWQKSKENDCYNKKQLLAESEVVYPPLCDESIESDSAWYIPLRPCVVVPNPNIEGLGSIEKWPKRLHKAPQRVRDIPGRSETGFKKDTKKWRKRVKYYKKLFPPINGTDRIRNVMDMNTIYGSFAAALVDDPVWVMNVVSSYAANTLSVVYDRGLIGTYHDWCEAFSTYPRTYDLLHFDGLFTAESHRCEIKFVLLEMDRILRPDGTAIIRESDYFVDVVATIAKGMRWECRKEVTKDGINYEKILICQKKLKDSFHRNSTR
ncbi:probable methyltransferase PMT21 [Impatiens glandulifera]|uniref:probable methyltransferase PMT21 n=1 Tax=Impatiens glandulifera TaxID=253017 RepID=UPI001FB10B0C|nr:probable methyltransferase PMT21 [Impatiens glandulifera]